MVHRAAIQEQELPVLLPLAARLDGAGDEARDREALVARVERLQHGDLLGAEDGLDVVGNGRPPIAAHDGRARALRARLQGSS